MRMHSDRLPEESKRALRTVLDGLRRMAAQNGKPAEEQDDIPQQDPPYVLFQKLLAAAKAPREQDNIDDVLECFGGPKLEPVLPLDPPQHHDRWDLMAASMRLADAEFVERHKPKIRGFRRKQVSVYWMYVDSLKRDFRALYGKILNLSREDEQLDAFEVHERRFRMEWLFMRLRLAGAVYLVNGRAGERMSNEAIAELRPMFSALPTTA